MRFTQYGINTGDLIVGVVGMAEGTRGIQCSANTLERRAGLVAASVQHALKADDQGFFGQSFQSLCQPVPARSRFPVKSAGCG